MNKTDRIKIPHEECVGSFYKEPAWHKRMNELKQQEPVKEPDWPQTCKNN